MSNFIPPKIWLRSVLLLWLSSFPLQFLSQSGKDRYALVFLKVETDRDKTIFASESYLWSRQWEVMPTLRHYRPCANVFNCDGQHFWKCTSYDQSNHLKTAIGKHHYSIHCVLPIYSDNFKTHTDYLFRESKHPS